jgi:spore maturation protein CgeB
LKITIFGLTLSSSWGNGHATPYRALIKALHERGAEVTFYEKDVPYYARHRDFTSCEYCRLVLYENWDCIRPRALREARDSDVVITASYCPDGADISDDVLEFCEPLRVFYDLDTPITLNKLVSGTVDYLRREQIPEFDLYLSFTGGKVLQRLQHEFAASCIGTLYGCVDPDIYHRIPARNDFACTLSYMGTYASDRQQKLDDLLFEPARRLPERNFLLAGSLYPEPCEWPSNVRTLEHISPQEHPALFSSSRATLNVTRKAMAESGYCPSGRFFEAAACGTPIFSDNWEGLDAFFDVDQELCVVNSADDVISSLALSDSELSRLAERARQRTLDEHTGRHRAQQLINYCQGARRSSQSIQQVSR